MVITTDFNIFADKYHNKQHLPDDIIKMIMNINTQEIKPKKNYKEVINTINQIRIYDDDGNSSIQDLTSNDELSWRDATIECVFIEPLISRMFDVINELNIENYHTKFYKKHKINKGTLLRSSQFYEFFWTLSTGLDNMSDYEYFDDYKRLYPENFLRDWE